MAEVKTTEYIEKTFPSWNQGQTYVYNNELYVVTTTTIYKYNLQLDSYETVRTRANAGLYPLSWKYGNAIYMYGRKNGYYTRFDKYDLSTGTYTENVFQVELAGGNNTTVYQLYAKGTALYVTYYAISGSYRGWNYDKFTINYTNNTATRNWYKEAYTNNYDYNRVFPYAYITYNNVVYVIGNRYQNNNVFIGTINESNGNGTVLTSIAGSGNVQGTAYGKDGILYIFIGNKQYTYNIASNVLALVDDTTPFDISYQNIVEYGTSYIIMNSTGYYRISYNIYELTYAIKNNDGTETYDTVTDAAPITKVEFIHDRQNNIVAYSFTTLAGVVTGTYTPQLPTGKTLAGYTTTQGGQTVQIPLANEISTSITADTVFYEVYKKYVPPTTTFNVELYQNTANNLVLDKTSFLTLIDTLSGALRDRCDIINPTIVIEYNAIPDFNYVHIPIWGRYYYVDKIVSVRVGLWEISLTLDERFSYKDGILGLKNVLIARAESATWYNPYLVDELIPTEAGTVRTVTEIPNTSLPAGDPMYPFVVAVVAVGST